MIYFNENLLQIPRHGGENSNELVLINELTGEKYEGTFTDQSTDTRYYLFVPEGFDDLIDGTYRYQIGSEVGLCQVGEYVNVAAQYNEKKQNTVYER